MSRKLRLAYITTHYPALSHTFILREVAALRRIGAEVHTISLRRTAGDHLLARENREAAQSTYAVLPARLQDVLTAHFSALLAHPGAYLATLREALGLARPGLRGRVWQVFYFAEAIIVWQHCRRRRVSHIHAHHGAAPADVAMLAALYGSVARADPCRWSLTLHGPIEFNDVQWFALAEKARRADAVVCVSNFARSQLMALLDDRHWSKLRVVHCGVRPADYEDIEHVPCSRPQLLCVGRLVAEKGHAVMLQALARLTREGRDLETVLVGSGPQRARLEQLARELGIGERVAFRGALAQEQMRGCYASATLFCSSSFAEGVPVVLMEAMACGRAVIATAIAGVRELVRDGDTGLLVTPGDARELSSAIARLLDDPELGARLASAGREHVAREFDVDRCAAQLARVFDEIASRSRPQSGEPAPILAEPVLAHAS